VMSFESNAGNGWGSGVINNFFFGTGSTFATGQAAANLTSSAQVTNSTSTDEITVKGLPKRPNIFKLLFTKLHRYRPFTEDEMFPMISGTKTVYGLDVQWDPASQTPRAVKAGFNRKEISYAPLIASGVKSEDALTSNQNVKLKLPSVIAGHQMNTKTEGGVKFGHVQFLATGRAAENLGGNSDARSLLKMKLVEAKPETQTADKPAETGEGQTGGGN
jgi:hypothetical protein